MANIYKYRGEVRGIEKAVYAFYGSLPVLDYKDILSVKTLKDGKVVLKFEGDCNWSMDSRTTFETDLDDNYLDKLPDDPIKAEKQGEEDLQYLTTKLKSKLLQVEVKYCGADIDDNNSDDIQQDWIHYMNGEYTFVEVTFPKWMKIKREELL